MLVEMTGVGGGLELHDPLATGSVTLTVLALVALSPLDVHGAAPR
jgi:hypothetical protein